MYIVIVLCNLSLKLHLLTHLVVSALHLSAASVSPRPAPPTERGVRVRAYTHVTYVGQYCLPEDFLLVGLRALAAEHAQAAL